MAVREALHTAGRVVAVERDGGRTMLVVESAASRHRLAVDARPDSVLAHRLTAGLRRVRWVRIAGSPLGSSCELVGMAHRCPVRRRVPLSAALALAAEGIPTLVTGAELGAV